MNIPDCFWKVAKEADVPKPTEYTLEDLKAMERESWNETEFGNQMYAVAKGLGWKGAHFRAGMTGRLDAAGKPVWVTPLQGDAKGWPDWALFRGKRKLAWELKVYPNKPSPEQLAWLDILELAGFEVAVCYPKHWETMCKILEAHE